MSQARAFVSLGWELNITGAVTVAKVDTRSRRDSHLPRKNSQCHFIPRNRRNEQSWVFSLFSLALSSVSPRADLGALAGSVHKAALGTHGLREAALPSLVTVWRIGALLTWKGNVNWEIECLNLIWSPKYYFFVLNNFLFRYIMSCNDQLYKILLTLFPSVAEELRKMLNSVEDPQNTYIRRLLYLYLYLNWLSDLSFELWWNFVKVKYKISCLQ